MTWVFEEKVVRDIPAREPLWAAVVIGALTFIVLILSGLFGAALFFKWNSIPDQQMIGFWLGTLFLALGMIFMLYRKYFVNDMLVIKYRKEKLEDMTVRDLKLDD